MRVMFVKPGCPYCQDARDEMTAEGIEWREIDATRDALYKKQLMRYSKNTGTVPTIIEGDEVITIGWKGRG